MVSEKVAGALRDHAAARPGIVGVPIRGAAISVTVEYLANKAGVVRAVA